MKRPASWRILYKRTTYFIFTLNGLERNSYIPGRRKGGGERGGGRGVGGEGGGLTENHWSGPRPRWPPSAWVSSWGTPGAPTSPWSTPPGSRLENSYSSYCIKQVKFLLHNDARQWSTITIKKIIQLYILNFCYFINNHAHHAISHKCMQNYTWPCRFLQNYARIFNWKHSYVIWYQTVQAYTELCTIMQFNCARSSKFM